MRTAEQTKVFVKDGKIGLVLDDIRDLKRNKDGQLELGSEYAGGMRIELADGTIEWGSVHLWSQGGFDQYVRQHGPIVRIAGFYGNLASGDDAKNINALREVIDPVCRFIKEMEL